MSSHPESKHLFPSNKTVEMFLKTSNESREGSTSGLAQIFNQVIYPTFLLLGTIGSIHYAINPVGNARRMIMENRMNPIMLRVRHALPFVFAGLMFSHFNNIFFYEALNISNQRQKEVDALYTKNPELFKGLTLGQ